MPQDLPVILHNEKRGLLTVEEGRLDVLQLSRDGRPPKRLLSCSTRNVLRARLAPTSPGQQQRLDLHVLIAKGNTLRLSKMHVLVEPTSASEAQDWVDLVMATAYPGVKPFRRVLLLVNPVGGKGKAKAIVRDDVLPVLEAAGCVVEVRETTHRLHAQEIVQAIDLVYDVIATASGDGLIFEVWNGLAARPDAKKALKIPIGPIPTGSANSLCINLFGPKDTFNIQLACLNVIKGQHMPKDLCSVLLLPSRQRVWSFLSLAAGLMVDLDIGTEHLRWMGDTRFTLGFIKGVGTSKNHRMRITMRVVAEDKVEMARTAREWAKGILAEPPMGGGVDPLGNGVKKIDIKKESPRPTALVPGAPSEDEPVVNGANGENGSKSIDDQGPLPESQLLKPDETWTIIESGPKPSAATQVKNGMASRTGQSGGWIDGQGILYAYAGNMPWIARDLMQWPVSVQGSGAFDVVIQSIVPRARILAAITGAAKGEQYWMECQHYYKVDALVVENLDKENQKVWSLDGEAFPYDSYHVELHTGLATVLSLDGHFHIPEFMKRHDNK